MATDFVVQSACPRPAPTGLHVAVIMDGNGRWAEARGLPRAAGHRAGIEAVRRLVRAAPRLGVGTLTLYAFSADNWSRPEIEVRSLLVLLREYLRRERAALGRHGVRLMVIGRRDRLPLPLREAIREAEAATAAGGRLDLRIAIDYSAREAIAEAAATLAGTGNGAAGAGDAAAVGGGAVTADSLRRERFRERLAAAIHGAPETPDVDLLVRAGGEKRLSDFLLWECAYAELWFTRTPWPAFRARHLAAAVGAYHRRERRFGGLAPASGA
jgi:undecaprenyl diphosphate synthase